MPDSTLGIAEQGLAPGTANANPRPSKSGQGIQGCLFNEKFSLGSLEEVRDRRECAWALLPALRSPQALPAPALAPLAGRPPLLSAPEPAR